MSDAATEPKANWFRQLKGGRMEVFLVGNFQDDASLPVKVRASGPEWAVWKTVDFFEEITGREVVGEWRRPPRTGPRPLAGQLSITEQLESDHGSD